MFSDNIQQFYGDLKKHSPSLFLFSSNLFCYVHVFICKVLLNIERFF